MIEQFTIDMNNLLSIEENRQIRNQIREDYLYEILRSSTSTGLMLPNQILDVIRGISSRKIETCITEPIKEKYNNLDKIVDNTLIRYLVCKNYFNMSYEDYKFISETDFSEIKFEDKDFSEFIENIKDIQQGLFSIYSKPQANIKYRVLNKFKSEYNKTISNCDDFKGVSSDFLEEYNLSNSLGIDIRDSGYDFHFLVKDMSYAGRPISANMSYKDYYNVDEHHFPTESKSLVSNSLFSTIGSLSEFISTEHLLVGYNELKELFDASTADLASEKINGSVQTYLKTGKNVKHLCNPNSLLKSTGIIKDDNTAICVYNEIVDTKYDENDKKIQPDFVVYALSKNPNSKFSDHTQERFKCACKAAKEFGVPLVFVDLDKIARNEFEVVNKKVEQFKKNSSPELLRDILGQIRMNRATDYATKPFDEKFLFSDRFLTDLIIQLYTPQNKDIFYEELNNMPNFKFDDFKRRIEMKISLCNSLKNNEELSKIVSARSLDQLKLHVVEKEREEITKFDQELKKKKKSFFKTSKLKKQISQLENEKKVLEYNIMARIKSNSIDELTKIGICTISDGKNMNSLDEMILSSISHYNDILDIFKREKKVYEDVPSVITIENRRVSKANFNLTQTSNKMK